ncbi:17168_t:CDS:1 [Acaulospora morrowiae]|uniref:17168_t:CDS:1 n=1 Tax=Acaulospora morrowiae TaxID=94023 RepID=A0A9N8ZMW7_9GLOM|nr:17168_t:CDS:1 [Acaulospora morrowiae]
MGDDGSYLESDRGPISGMHTEEIAETTESYILGAAQRGSSLAGSVGAASRGATEVISHTTESFVEKGMDVLKHPGMYLQPLYKASMYLWQNFPPISWFGYSAAALNAIPIIILLGFLFGTCAFVLSIAGIGIFLAEGFFLGLGLLFLVPVVCVLTFATLTTSFFTVFGYGCYRAAVFILRGLGVLGEEIIVDTKGVAQGVERAVSHLQE